MTSPELVVSKLTKSYAAGEGEVPVLRDVDLALSRGQSLVVMGPSGSGKSTLLYILGALEPPTSGEVKLAGENPWSLTEPQQARFRNQRVGFVFQDHHLLPQCTVLENVVMPALPVHGITSATQARARHLLERVGLGHRLHHRPGQLSGGERQRVAVCRALINEPMLLLADEPTGNLDRSNAEAVGRLLLELHQEQQTLLICVTHSQELAHMFPQIVVLRDGQLASASQTVI